VVCANEGEGVTAGGVTSNGTPLPPLAWRGLAVVCAVLTAVLLVASSRYARILMCVGPRGTWASIWPRCAHLSN